MSDNATPETAIDWCKSFYEMGLSQPSKIKNLDALRTIIDFKMEECAMTMVEVAVEQFHAQEGLAELPCFKALYERAVKILERERVQA